jgi:REP element-mobilizing transposase RayT
LMPNHVHMIVVPQYVESLRRAIGEAHRWYTRRINFREGWRGHLWKGRFAWERNGPPTCWHMGNEGGPNVTAANPKGRIVVRD